MWAHHVMALFNVMLGDQLIAAMVTGLISSDDICGSVCV
ncbi:hypothetical protein shim_25000 [Shimia sp. SK013]|nr:hypothetical protein shim_25000 [Shimia sp. SK013]